MKFTSKLRHLHISPQKCRLVADLIRGLDVEKAEVQLKNTRKKSAEALLKLLNSAIASANHNYNIEKSNLNIDKIIVNEGNVMKRWKPRAFGRAYPIIKRTCHVELTLKEKVAGKKTASKGKSIKENKEEGKKKKTKDNKDNKFDKNNNNLKPSKDSGVFKKMFRRKSV